MKTKEQIQEELNTYLTKTSQHVFVSEGESNKYFRVVETTTKDNEKIWFSIWLDENLEPKSIDRYIDIDYHPTSNSKCVIKHSLFLNRGMKSVKLKNKTQWVADSLIETVKNMAKPPLNWRERDVYMKNLIESLKVI